MSLTKERIAEIAARAQQTCNRFESFDAEDVAELCRLALLGLRVEEAPDVYPLLAWALTSDGDTVQRSVISNRILPAEWIGKRVRIVVEEP